MADKFWMGPISHCDVCRATLEKVFFDARTNGGPWACMCLSCQTVGPGLGKTGPGVGQKYELQDSGKWLKTEG